MCLLRSSDLPAKSPVRMTDSKLLDIFWDAGNFYHCRLQILGNLSGKHFGWNGKSEGYLHRSFQETKKGEKREAKRREVVGE